MSNGNNNDVGPSGHTTLTKVFVGGLAWETPNEALRDHFQKYGDIFEAVIISDKITGRSRGYGFVTFKQPESAKKACEDPSPVINGRRANCNLASFGARRPISSAVAPPHQIGPRSAGTLTPPARHVQWYYPPAPTPATPYYHRRIHQTAVPFYGYAPAMFVATNDVGYNHKLGYSRGPYTHGVPYTQLYPSQPMLGANTLVARHPLQPYHQGNVLSQPAHIYYHTIAAGPFHLTKPTKIPPITGTIGGR